jgi:hypothetical protein
MEELDGHPGHPGVSGGIRGDPERARYPAVPGMGDGGCVKG